MSEERGIAQNQLSANERAGNELVEVPGGAYMLDQGAPPFWTNIDTASDQGKALLFKCDAPSDWSADDMVAMPFPCKWLYASPVDLVNKETGEITQSVRSVLVGPEGETVSFVSTGVIKSLRKIVATYGKGPWTPPIQLQLRVVTTNNKRRLYLLEPVLTLPAPKGGGSNG